MFRAKNAASVVTDRFRHAASEVGAVAEAEDDAQRREAIDDHGHPSSWDQTARSEGTGDGRVRTVENETMFRRRIKEMDLEELERYLIARSADFEELSATSSLEDMVAHASEFVIICSRPDRVRRDGLIQHVPSGLVYMDDDDARNQRNVAALVEAGSRIVPKMLNRDGTPYRPTLWERLWMMWPF